MFLNWNKGIIFKLNSNLSLKHILLNELYVKILLDLIGKHNTMLALTVECIAYHIGC